MLKLFSAFLTVFVLQAHASDPQILGRWISEDPIVHNGPLLVNVGFDFKGDETADMSSICSYPNSELEAVVTVSVEVSEGKIRVLSGGNQKINEKGIECISSVDPGIVDYSIKDNVLTVSAGGQSMNFVRR